MTKDKLLDVLWQVYNHEILPDVAMTAVEAYSSASNGAKHLLAVRADKLRPCDCKDAVDTSKLEEQGIGHNDESIKVIPNYVLLKIGHTEITISMKRFKMFAEWYLSEQDVRHDH